MRRNVKSVNEIKEKAEKDVQKDLLKFDSFESIFH